MINEQAVLNHLNKNEERIRYFLTNYDFVKADAEITIQTKCIELLNIMGYKIIEDPNMSKNIEGYWVMKYTKIEERG